MRKIDVVDAAEDLGALLDLVEKGEEVMITRHGKPDARLVRPEGTHDRAKALAAVERIRELAKGQTLGGISIKDLIEDGRR
jgi:prevent-host-death family protein